MNRRERAQRDAEVLLAIRERIEAINESNIYDGLVDHISQKARLARDTARFARVDQGGR